MRRDRSRQRCLNALLFAAGAALALAITHHPRLSAAASLIALATFFALSVRSDRR
ncbi:MAG: hypothetical protein ACRYFW_14390 [Janthinobacterium lividum]